MRGYITGICLSAVITAIADMIAPGEYRKYIRVLLGFLVLSVILSPLPAVKNIRLGSIEQKTAENTGIFYDSVSEKLKENVEADIEERLKNEFGIICSASAELDIDGEHKIRGVRRIGLSKKIPQNAAERLKEVYGCDRIE